MATTQPQRIKTISEFHQLRGLPKPEHPLVSVVDCESFTSVGNEEGNNLVLDFYSIALKRNFNGKMKYGQQEYDFDEGVLFFISPGQVFSITQRGEGISSPKGWILMVHPDFLWNTPLAKAIQQYEYFDYAVNEALFLSDKEETTIAGILQHIVQEYRSNIDRFSQAVIIAHIELLLTYAERFYQRQFLTRTITNHKILERLEAILSNWFNSDALATKGMPTVQHISEALNISPNYLSGLLKTLTGQSTQQHIHDKLIEKAKEKLSTTELSVSEIAYELGFEYPQSFSKLFKNKTNLSPLEFRHLFN